MSQSVYAVIGTELIVTGQGRKWRVRRNISLGLVTHELFTTKREAVRWATDHPNAPALT
jgi:hypothetical protein